MECLYCGKEFSHNGKPGGNNRTFCYDCIPEGLSKKERDNVRGYYLLQKSNELKLSLGCSICGYDKCPTALEWHHTEGKDYSPANTINISWSKYLEETEKCQLVCTNCHREIHYKGD